MKKVPEKVTLKLKIKFITLNSGTMNKVKPVDLSGLEIFCGLDYHKRTWCVNIRTSEVELEHFTMDANKEGLLNHLMHNYQGATIHVAYEAGFSGFGLQRWLTDNDIHCVVVNAADVPSSSKDKQRKSDHIDARKLSRELSKGMLQGIYIPKPQLEHARSLVRQRERLVRDQTRCKARIRHLIMFSGLQVSENKYWSARFVKQLQELSCGTVELRQTLDLALEEYLKVRELLLKATRMIRTLSKESPYAKLISLLRTVPGIALINSMVLLTELQDMHRFKTLDKLCGYVGLVPDSHDSGDQISTRRITHRSNSYLRKTIIEASWTAFRKDPALLLCKRKYNERMNSNRAIIRIARHLLARIRVVWLNEVQYQKGVTG